MALLNKKETRSAHRETVAILLYNNCDRITIRVHVIHADQLPFAITCSVTGSSNCTIIKPKATGGTRNGATQDARVQSNVQYGEFLYAIYWTLVGNNLGVAGREA